MKLCITSTGRDLDAPVDPTFGRARFFLFVELETMTVDVAENQPGAHGAGVQAAQAMAENGAEAILTGNVGPNAYQGLAAAGISIYTGVKGTGREAVEAYRAGTLHSTAGPTQGRHGGGGGRRR